MRAGYAFNATTSKDTFELTTTSLSPCGHLYQITATIFRPGWRSIHLLLRIENGRFTIAKTAENLRICHHCTLNSVEVKMHFLFHCTFYDDLRNFLFDKGIERHGLFANFDYQEKVLFLFNNADPHIRRLTAAFVFRAMEKRSKHAH